VPLVGVPVSLATLHTPCRVPLWNVLPTRFLAHHWDDYEPKLLMRY
jgi:hypothetical protein